MMVSERETDAAHFKKIPLTLEQLKELEAEELKEAFDEWFTHLLLQQSTCSYRDVLRDCRKELFAAFKVRRPIWTSLEIEQSKQEAAELMKVLK